MDTEKNCELKRSLEDALRSVALLPVREYEPETMLAVGAVGLDMNSFIAELCMKQQEYKDAPEYIERGQKTDVEESMADYCKLWRRLLKIVARWEHDLNQDNEKDTEVRNAIWHLAEAYREVLNCLIQCVSLPDDPEEVRECMEQYLEWISLLYDVTKGYCRLHVGDSSYLD